MNSDPIRMIRSDWIHLNRIGIIIGRVGKTMHLDFWLIESIRLNFLFFININLSSMKSKTAQSDSMEHFQWREDVSECPYLIWNELLVPRWSRSWQRQAIISASTSISPRIFHHWVPFQIYLNQSTSINSVQSYPIRAYPTSSHSIQIAALSSWLLLIWNNSIVSAFLLRFLSANDSIQVGQLQVM